jgi:hypothetical protein
MTYACSTWEHAADTHPLKLQRLQNRVLRAIGKLDRCTPVRELQVAFRLPYVYNYINKLFRTQAEVILNHVNPNYMVLDKEKPCIGSITDKFGGGQAYDRSANYSFRVVK